MNKTTSELKRFFRVSFQKAKLYVSEDMVNPVTAGFKTFYEIVLPYLKIHFDFSEDNTPKNSSLIFRKRNILRRAGHC